MYITGIESDIDDIWVSKDHGNLLSIIDIELWKYRYRSVFDTLVVYTVNSWVLCISLHYYISLRVNTSPGKKSQDRVPNEIGGSLHKRWSMWFNSTVHVKPYQSQWFWYTPIINKCLRDSNLLALHGYRQFVLWYVTLSCWTNAIPILK